MRPVTLMSDAEIVAELAHRGHEAQPPANSHLPVHERRAAAGGTVGEHGLCTEAEERLALRTRLRALRTAG